MAETVDLNQPLEGLLYEKRNQIAYLTLNRPERGNALASFMEPAVKAIWEEVRDDDSIRCAIITGAGDRHFCTGADMAIVAKNARVSGTGPVTDEVFWSPHQNRVWKPVICAVENIGLAKRLPLGTALRMTLQGRDYRLPAERAYQLGLVDELVPKEELMEKAEEIAQSIMKSSPHALALSKQAVWSSVEMGYKNSIEYGYALLRLHWQHPDFVEGPRAFAEKRDPQWTTDGDPASWRKTIQEMD